MSENALRIVLALATMLQLACARDPDANDDASDESGMDESDTVGAEETSADSGDPMACEISDMADVCPYMGWSDLPELLPLACTTESGCGTLYIEFPSDPELYDPNFTLETYNCIAAGLRDGTLGRYVLSAWHPENYETEAVFDVLPGRRIQRARLWPATDDSSCAWSTTIAELRDPSHFESCLAEQDDDLKALCLMDYEVIPTACLTEEDITCQ